VELGIRARGYGSVRTDRILITAGRDEVKERRAGEKEEQKGGGRWRRLTYDELNICGAGDCVWRAKPDGLSSLETNVIVGERLWMRRGNRRRREDGEDKEK